jgi:glycosyltransferase involved in cell wall biosynthesis
VSDATRNGWVVLTGEYPPEPGGVADYTRRLAHALALAGDDVEVWAPTHGRELARDAGVTVRGLPDQFGPRSLALLHRELVNREDVRLLVQWVPHAFGMRAMNVPFCAWVAAQRARTWIMFHEVNYPFNRGAPLRHNGLAAVTHAMSAVLAARADRSFVSTPAWTTRLRTVAPFAREATWLPIPSNIPESVTPGGAARVRASRGLRPDEVILGSFGTYAPHIAEPLADALVSLLSHDPSRVALLMGRGSVEFVERALGPRLAAVSGGSEAAARAIATDELSPDDLAAHIAACDAVIQPYVDGVTTRRTTAMAGLALGIPVITNDGPLTESIWRDEIGVVLARSTAEIAHQAESWLVDRPRLRDLGAKGRALYQREFALDCTVRTLREGALQ